MTMISNIDAVILSSVMIFIYRFKDLQIYGAQTHDHRFKPSSNFQILISWHNHKMAKCRQNNVIRKRVYFLGTDEDAKAYLQYMLMQIYQKNLDISQGTGVYFFYLV